MIEDPAFLPVIYEAQPDRDWASPDVWRQANPNLGLTASLEYLEREFRRAKETPTYENTFKRLHLNMKTQQEVHWLTLEAWDQCGKAVDRASLRGKECFAGRDLSTTQDVTALVLLFPERVKGSQSDAMHPPISSYTVLPFFWIPGDNARKRERRDRVPYETWGRQGLIELSARQRGRLRPHPGQAGRAEA